MSEKKISRKRKSLRKRKRKLKKKKSRPPMSETGTVSGDDVGGSLDRTKEMYYSVVKAHNFTTVRQLQPVRT
jgi:uncharacterized protein (DUF2225 family)